ncbi:hypothetical protein Dda_0057 [Drechslerella dactyloides]|uniref:Uncharacterized protein n=1 Tax=Drechslerella dactyloides TaxID=74499 RepID=A0AAD6NN38_DREDA|nr:hypothetical protein Dda_0057 [Drechslerella dactyloides]
MGRVYTWTCSRQEKLKEGLKRLISAIQTFRNALESTRSYFVQNVYTTPPEQLIAHHQLVFQTAVALHTQNRVTTQAAKLIRCVRRSYYDKGTKSWDDDDMKQLTVELHEQVSGCNEETKVMLQEMGTRFTVQIRFYENEREEGEIPEEGPLAAEQQSRATEIHLPGGKNTWTLRSLHKVPQRSQLGYLTFCYSSAPWLNNFTSSYLLSPSPSREDNLTSKASNFNTGHTELQCSSTMPKSHRSARKRAGENERKALQKLLAEGDAAAASSSRTVAQDTGQGHPAMPSSSVPSQAEGALRSLESRFPMSSSSSGINATPQVGCPPIHLRHAIFDAKQERERVMKEQETRQNTTAPPNTAPSESYGFVVVKRLTMIQMKKSADNLIVKLLRLIHDAGDGEHAPVDFARLINTAAKIGIVKPSDQDISQQAGTCFSKGIGLPPYRHVPVYVQRSPNTGNDEFLLRPNSIPFGTIKETYPGIKLPAWPIPKEAFERLNKGETDADWISAWPFLVHTIFNEGYLAGNQLILWADDGKLCWATLDDPDVFLPALATMKNAWPRFHAFHDQNTGGPCRDCLDEMDDRDFVDFAPALGFPSISRPKGYRPSLSRKKGKKLKKGRRVMQQALKTDCDDKAGSTTEKAPQKIEHPVPHRFVPGLSPEGLVVDFDVETKTFTSKVVPASAADRKASVNAKGIISTAGSSSRGPGSNSGAGDNGPSATLLTEGTPKQTQPKPTLFSPAAAPPLGPAKKVSERLTPKLKKTMSAQIYEQLRTQRIELSLGIGRFVIDAIKAGKRPFFDISLDGRIELGHWGDAFPIKHGREQYGKKFINDILSEPCNPEPVITMCTAPVLRITDRKFKSMDGFKRDMEFPFSVGGQDMFKEVEVGEPDVEDPKGKGKQPEKETSGYTPLVNFGSAKYKIKAAIRGEVYGDVEILAQDIITALDVCDEAQTWLFSMDRDMVALHKELPSAPSIPGSSSFKHANCSGEKALKSPVWKKDSMPMPPAGAKPPVVLEDALLYQKEELLQLLKEIPPGHKPEKMDFEKNLKKMDECLKKMQKNTEEVQDVIRDTLRDHPPPQKLPGPAKTAGNKGKDK